MYIILNEAILPYFYRLVKSGKAQDFILLKYPERERDFLKFLDKIITKHKIKLKNIEGLIIISAENSFTQLRLKITILNLFKEFLNIPTSFLKINKDIDNKNNNEIEKIIKVAKTKLKRKNILPIYNKEPNIHQKIHI